MTISIGELNAQRQLASGVLHLGKLTVSLVWMLAARDDARLDHLLPGNGFESCSSSLCSLKFVN